MLYLNSNSGAREKTSHRMSHSFVTFHIGNEEHVWNRTLEFVLDIFQISSYIIIYFCALERFWQWKSRCERLDQRFAPELRFSWKWLLSKLYLNSNSGAWEKTSHRRSNIFITFHISDYKNSSNRTLECILDNFSTKFIPNSRCLSLGELLNIRKSYLKIGILIKWLLIRLRLQQ